MSKHHEEKVFDPTNTTSSLGLWALQYISEFTDIITCLNMVCLCIYTRNNLQIKYIPDNKRNLNDIILQQKRYLHLIVLNAFNNPKISKIGHLIELKELNAGCSCGIGDDQLQKLHLLKLNAAHNSKINKIGHIRQLKELNAGGHLCGIDDDQLPFGLGRRSSKLNIFQITKEI